MSHIFAKINQNVRQKKWDETRSPQRFDPPFSLLVRERGNELEVLSD